MSTAPLGPPRQPRLPSAARVWVPTLAFLLLGVLGAALGHVWVRLQQIQVGYALSHERHEARALAETQKRLRLEAAVLKQPQRIERIARVRLGMTAPDPAAIHVIRVARSAGRRPAATHTALARGGEATPAAAAAAAVAAPRSTAVTEVRP
jgi:cell division protein FtsL